MLVEGLKPFILFKYVNKAFKDREGIFSNRKFGVRITALLDCRSTLEERQESRVGDLPSEILVDIFLKLPVKYLIRMKCTCKLWYAVISDPKFVELHFDKATKNPGHLYTFSHYTGPYICIAERVSDNMVAMKIPRGTLVETMYEHYSNTSGGLLARIIPHEKCCYISNPIIGEEIKVFMSPYFGENFQDKWWGFSYSFSTKEYKLINFAKPRIDGLFEEEGDVCLGAIYTLGSESWREIPDVPVIPDTGRGHVDCEGTLFWLIFYDDDIIVPRTNTIASFDVGSEEFRLWQGPNTNMDQDSWRDYLFKFGDTVACVKAQVDSSVSIFILRDKVNEVWNNEYIIRLTQGVYNYREPQFFGLWMNRDLFCHRDARFYSYDAKNRQFKFVWLPFSEVLSYYPRRDTVHSHVVCLISPSRIMGK